MITEEEQFNKIYLNFLNGNRNNIRDIINRFDSAKLVRFLIYYNEQYNAYNLGWAKTIEDINSLLNN